MKKIAIAGANQILRTLAREHLVERLQETGVVSWSMTTNLAGVILRPILEGSSEHPAFVQEFVALVEKFFDQKGFFTEHEQGGKEGAILLDDISTLAGLDIAKELGFFVVLLVSNDEEENHTELDHNSGADLVLQITDPELSLDGLRQKCRDVIDIFFPSE